MKEDFLSMRLRARVEEGLLRSLSCKNGLVDFVSNDYLGFARSEEFEGLLNEELSILNHQRLDLNISPSGGFWGATGSRLLAGNTKYAEDLEKYIAEFHGAEAGLIFNSGYDANVGVISALGRKGDVIFYDELSHASIYDGVRLSRAASFPFKHNDINHLENRLKQIPSSGGGGTFVIIESIYSMDGDSAPLKKISSLCKKYNAFLLVDYAHAFPLCWPGFQIPTNCRCAAVVTFGKALGCHGAIVLGSKGLRTYLINFARSFIYTTALPLHSLAAIKSAYKLLANLNDKLLKTSIKISLYKDIIKKEKINGFIESESPIQSIIIPGNARVKKLASLIQKDGFDVRPILSPTVPKGKERLRICIHAFNTEEEIKGLLKSIKKNINLA